MSSAGKCKVAIVGGGIVGVSTAYFLASRGLGEGVVLIESTRIAAAASGKAGGFLARDWGTPGSTQELHERGFDLHEELAKVFGLASYRKLPTLQVDVKARASKASKKLKASDDAKDEVLLDPATTKSRMMDPDTAQVTPPELIDNMWSKAQQAGVELINAKATGLERLEGGGFAIKLVENGKSTADQTSSERTVEAEKVVLAMGPWTVDAEDWLGKSKLTVPMVGIASSSMVVHAGEGTKIAATACFCGDDAQGCHLEMYPRPDNSVYVCGFGGSPHLDKATLQQTGPDDVKPNEDRVPLAQKSFAHLTTGLSEGNERVDLQCCLRPCTDDATPMIGPVEPGKYDLLIGTGHNCWGILWGPITGSILADLVEKQATDVDLRPFNPLRFTRAA
ncbi:Hypothetical Protein FCC1311_034542 [Hondaea fermentalgiana]|uniref:FAD dependent oxidoreductase domain-containing protein n=1 Tax=Hondaea fermentalgiana TaxID=2315210 RepID=A0A2R5G852_9STRA|nr:Hypothetical Protein FCC1311_034542 [Hondaea fermentalgiana]|eukprot:GBG27232.1 Hypothetical Protein FCC1311_034542 [Hondaea fermentalgiana]